jgi:hypothetical protein
MSSLPGLTRQSIQLYKKFLTKKMDARVKPAHDLLDKSFTLPGPCAGTTMLPLQNEIKRGHLYS